MSESDPPAPPAAVDFGFQTVLRGEKAGRVRAVFDSVADRYDLMNDLMTGGLHRLWKTVLVDALLPRPGTTLLDVAGGTGDVALRWLDRLGALADARRGQALVVDANERMLEVGRDRALDRGIIAGPIRIAAMAEALPFSDRAVDACSIAFGLRNVTEIDTALREMHRVLKPGGRFACLEFSRVALPLLGPLYERYSFTVIPWLGEQVTGEPAAYRYLVESIRRFPAQEALATRMRQVGFERVHHRNLAGGIVALHTAWRL
ncbi:MAG: class I SAM-dependent methyltransferase [Alphaproteobacteria bacterium]|nr:class I SAM-dependent methyltransferase [Alphaproteobacteria bacterium]